MTYTPWEDIAMLMLRGFISWKTWTVLGVTTTAWRMMKRVAHMCGKRTDR